MIVDRASPADHHYYRVDDSGGNFEKVSPLHVLLIQIYVYDVVSV